MQRWISKWISQTSIFIKRSIGPPNAQQRNDYKSDLISSVFLFYCIFSLFISLCLSQSVSLVFFFFFLISRKVWILTRQTAHITFSKGSQFCSRMTVIKTHGKIGISFIVWTTSHEQLNDHDQYFHPFLNETNFDKTDSTKWYVSLHICHTIFEIDSI